MAINHSLITAPPQRCVLEKPKNDVRLTDTCHGHLPNGAFLPPTIRVSGRDCIVGIPHSTFLAAEIVLRPGATVNGGSDSVGKIISVELTVVGLSVVVVVVLNVVVVSGVVVLLVVVYVGLYVVDVLCVVIGFTGFALNVMRNVNCLNFKDQLKFLPVVLV